MKLPSSSDTSKKRQYLLLKLADFSKKHVAVFAVVFGAIGGIILLNGSSARLSAPSVYLNPATLSVQPGANFTVEVHMNSGEVPVNAVQADFSYPAELVEFVSIDGTGSAFTTEAPSTGTNGKVSIARGNIQPVSGEKLIAKVNFKAKAGTGTANLSFVDGTVLLSAADNNDLLGGLQKTAGTVVTIGSGTNPNPNPNPNPGTSKLSLNPATATVAPNGEFTVEVRSNSGTTTVNAVQADFSYPAELVEFVSIDGTGSAFTTEAPSTGGSGKVSIARGNIEPVSGNQLVAKVRFKAKAGTGTATMAFVAGTALLDATNNTDILGGLSGTSGTTVTIGGGTTPNPNPNPPTPNPNPNPGNSKLYLSPATASAAPNTNVTVEVRVNSGSTTINAVQADFSYPTNLVDFVSIDGAGSAFTTEAPSTGGNGKVSIARGNIQPVSGDKLVAKVTFKTKVAGTATMSFVEGSAVLNATDNTDLLGSLSETAGSVVTISSSGNPNPTPKAGDIDGNGKVDFEDLAKFLLRWGTGDAAADFDKDGRVTIYDLSILLSNYGG